MPGPPKQFDRDAALMKAMQVFWSRGYEATSVQDLVDAVGINRSSMYATFGDKQALFLEALRLYSDVLFGQLGPILRGRGTPLSRLRRAFKYMAQQTQEPEFHGCFAGNTATELGVTNETAADIVRNTLHRWRRMVKGVLDEAVEAGELAAGTDTETLSAFLLTFVQGLGITGQVKMPVANINKLVDTVMRVATSDVWHSA